MFSKFPSINGWGYYEMLFLYGFSLIAITPTQCLLDNNWQLRRYVYDGDFVKYCFRPINLFFYYESEVFDIKGLGQLAFGIGTLCFSWYHLALPVAFIAYYPSLVILRPDEVPLLSWLSPVIGGLFFYLSYKMWMRGASRYDGSGS